MKTLPLISEECCPPILREELTAAEAEDMASALRAIAEPARLRILNLIATAEKHEACVCDLTEPLDLSQPTVSHHLKVLVDAGLLDRQQRGRWAFFRLVPGRLDIIRRALAS